MTGTSPSPPNEHDALLASIYEQINEHLRASDTKRDQVIGSYIIVLGATIAAWKDLAEWREILAASTALIGFASFAAASQYRRWHWIHSNSIATYQRVRAGNEPLTLQTFQRAWNANRQPVSVWHLMDPRQGVEIVMTYVLGFLSFIPVYLLMTEKGWGFASPFSGHLVPFLTDAVIYAVALTYISSRFSKRFQSFSVVKDAWMYRWLKEPPASQASLASSMRRRIWEWLSALLDPTVE